MGIECKENGCPYHDWKNQIDDLNKMIYYNFITERRAQELLEESQDLNHVWMAVGHKQNSGQQLTCYGHKHADNHKYKASSWITNQTANLASNRLMQWAL